MKSTTDQQRNRKCDGLVCYAGIDWWYHSQGHNDHQIMKRLARHLKVLWVNSIGMRFPRPGQTDLSAMRYFRKIRSTLKGLRRDVSGMWIYSPLFLPKYTAGALKINGYLLNLQVRIISRRLGIHNPSVWITVPTAAPAVLMGSWQKIFFNRCDHFSCNPETDQELIRYFENLLLRSSDEVFYSSHELMSSEKKMVKKGIYLGHGVDTIFFGPPAESRETPEVLRNLPRPIVGYYGALDTYTVDLPLLVKTARKISPGTLLIIGLKAMDISELTREKNVVYLEPVPYHMIPQYAQVFDVGIMPWLKNPWIRSSNPVKLKEYLAIGFPVVTIDFPELNPYRDLVLAANSHDDFLALLDVALKEKNKNRCLRRRQAVSESNWDKIAERVLSAIME